MNVLSLSGVSCFNNFIILSPSFLIFPDNYFYESSKLQSCVYIIIPETRESIRRNASIVMSLKYPRNSLLGTRSLVVVVDNVLANSRLMARPFREFLPTIAFR